MATTGLVYSAFVTGITGNTLTFGGQSWSIVMGTGEVIDIAALSGIKFDLNVDGDIHGLLYFPFGDQSTLDGALQPNDLRTAEIKLTDAASGAAVALVAEEVFGY